VVSVAENPKDRALRARASLKSEDYNIRRLGGEYGRFLVIGTINVTFFFSLYSTIYWLDPLGGALPTWGVAWVCAWIIGSVEAHALHRGITFRAGDTDYKESLMWSLAVYIPVLLMSTVSEYILIEYLELNHYLSWAINMSVFGPINFLGLRLLAFAPELDAEE